MKKIDAKAAQLDATDANPTDDDAAEGAGGEEDAMSPNLATRAGRLGRAKGNRNRRNSEVPLKGVRQFCFAFIELNCDLNLYYLTFAD